MVLLLMWMDQLMDLGHSGMNQPMAIDWISYQFFRFFISLFVHYEFII